jgi:NitT/TauT family transport system substrate-binding protein
MSPELVARAWSRMVITPDTTREAFQTFVTSAQQVGFLRDTPDLSRLIEAP